jgi:RNA polymerase sigma-70 factor, ECF subfamily
MEKVLGEPEVSTVPQETDLLLAKARGGDMEAVEELLILHEKKIYNIALRMMGNEEDAMDAAQEAMIKIYRNLPSFKGDCAFFSWVYRIVINVCLDALRRRKMGRIVYMGDTEAEKLFDIPDPTDETPENLFESSIKMETIKAALVRLEPEHRSVIVLRDVEGFSYNEISDMLGCNVGTVKSRINRARLQLQKLLFNDPELFS